MAPKDKFFELMYANEKLYSAIRYMVTNPRDLHERLHGAHSVFHVLSAHLADLPPDFRTRLENIFERFTREKAKGTEGNVRATLNVMSDEDAQELAGDIFDLYYAVHDQHAENKTKK
jgi:hypothetical protein